MRKHSNGITPATVPGPQVVGYWVTWLDRTGQPRQLFKRVLSHALTFQRRLPLGCGASVTPKVK